MEFKFVNLKINRIIIHQVFERDENKEIKDIRYGLELTGLDQDGLEVLEKRIINALGSNSHCIEMDIKNSANGSTYDILASMMDSDESNFINKSKGIAYKLAESQTRRDIPGGIVVLFDGTVGVKNHKFISVIKAEIHEGFTLDNKDSKLILKFISHLLLTPQQKLYKIGFFVKVTDEENEINSIQSEQVRVFVYDQNLNAMETSNAAVYFYSTFLGCSISPTNKKLTRDFYTNTKEFVKNSNLSDERKLDINDAIFTYMKVSQSNIVDVSDFAEQYLDVEERDEYCNYMREKKFPTTAILKDLTYIKNRLRQRKLKFTSKVSVIGPSENFKELVQIVGYEDEKTLIKVQGKIEEQQ